MNQITKALSAQGKDFESIVDNSIIPLVDPRIDSGLLEMLSQAQEILKYWRVYQESQLTDDYNLFINQKDSFIEKLPEDLQELVYEVVPIEDIDTISNELFVQMCQSVQDIVIKQVDKVASQDSQFEAFIQQLDAKLVEVKNDPESTKSILKSLTTNTIGSVYTRTDGQHLDGFKGMIQQTRDCVIPVYQMFLFIKAIKSHNLAPLNTATEEELIKKLLDSTFALFIINNIIPKLLKLCKQKSLLKDNADLNVLIETMQKYDSLGNCGSSLKTVKSYVGYQFFHSDKTYMMDPSKINQQLLQLTFLLLDLKENLQFFIKPLRQQQDPCSRQDENHQVGFTKCQFAIQFISDYLVLDDILKLKDMITRDDIDIDALVKIFKYDIIEGKLSHPEWSVLKASIHKIEAGSVTVTFKDIIPIPAFRRKQLTLLKDDKEEFGVLELIMDTIQTDLLDIISADAFKIPSKVPQFDCPNCCQVLTFTREEKKAIHPTSCKTKKSKTLSTGIETADKKHFDIAFVTPAVVSFPYKEEMKKTYKEQISSLTKVVEDQIHSIVQSEIKSQCITEQVREQIHSHGSHRALQLFKSEKPMLKKLLLADPAVITTLHLVFQSLLEGGVNSVIDLFCENRKELDEFVDYLLCKKDLDEPILKVIVNGSSQGLTKLLLSEDRIRRYVVCLSNPAKNKGKEKCDCGIIPHNDKRLHKSACIVHQFKQDQKLHKIDFISGQYKFIKQTTVTVSSPE